METFKFYMGAILKRIISDLPEDKPYDMHPELCVTLVLFLRPGWNGPVKENSQQLHSTTVARFLYGEAAMVKLVWKSLLLAVKICLHYSCRVDVRSMCVREIFFFLKSYVAT